MEDAWEIPDLPCDMKLSRGEPTPKVPVPTWNAQTDGINEKMEEMTRMECSSSQRRAPMHVCLHGRGRARGKSKSESAGVREAERKDGKAAGRKGCVLGWRGEKGAGKVLPVRPNCHLRLIDMQAQNRGGKASLSAPLSLGGERESVPSLLPKWHEGSAAPVCHAGSHFFFSFLSFPYSESSSFLPFPPSSSFVKKRSFPLR